MKKWIVTIVTAVLLMTSVQPVLAFGENESRSIENFFIETQLLKGDGSGYGLDREATRMEGVIMLIRLMGKEDAAREMQQQPCSFSDVPFWAAGYANYAVEANISNGIGENLFGSNDKMTARQFNAMMLRTIGYSDKDGDFQWDQAIEKASELSVLPADLAESFQTNTSYTKRDLVETAFCYLEAPEKNKDVTLIRELILNGAVQEDLAAKYGLTADDWNMIQTNYYSDDYLKFKVADGRLHITGSCKSEDRKWLMVSVNTVKTETEQLQEVSSADGDGQYDMVVSFAGIPKGEYSIDIYGNAEKYGYYKSVMSGALILEKTEEGILFQGSPVYGGNLRIYQGNQLEDQDSKMTLGTRASKKSIETVRSLAAMITEGSQTDYDKVRAIHDWVADNIYYDKDYIEDREKGTNLISSDVLENKNAVCGGYSNLTKDLINAVGIPCKQVPGFVLDPSEGQQWGDQDIRRREGNHIWNEAYVDGHWMMIDTTWDSANTYKQGTFTHGGILSHSYFDSSLEFISETHQLIEVDGF